MIAFPSTLCSGPSSALRMKRTLTLILAVVGLLGIWMLPVEVIYPENHYKDFTKNLIKGIWKDKAGTAVYAFMEKNEFWFGHYTYDNRFIKEEGWWKLVFTGECQNKAGAQGNLMVYVGTSQCCLIANPYEFKDRLVLSKVWLDPFRSGSDFCSNRVLMKAN